MAIPKQPGLCSKFNHVPSPHHGAIKLHFEVAKKFDYETGLAIVIGKTAKNISEAAALSYVGGYGTANDFSARDLQPGAGGPMAGWLSLGPVLPLRPVPGHRRPV
jgi:2-keto-4-pentenoate hydratase/2-oxohepta-3-ene-1,7-dioic acid hydratase in catechol pathway